MRFSSAQFHAAASFPYLIFSDCDIQVMAGDSQIPHPPSCHVVCPTADQLRQYGMGNQLAQETAELIEQHLESCSTCASHLEDLAELSDELIRALTALPTQPEDEPEFQQLVEQLITDPEMFSGTNLSYQTESLGPFQTDEELPRPLGGYELLALIGWGATGRVYRGRHVQLDKIVALKLLAPERMRDKETVARFRREMRAVGQLDHPNIIRATDAGEVDGQHFLVMEYVEGIDLSSTLKAIGPLPVREACMIACQAIQGLATAHERGMVHRDVKASNLMLTCLGDVKLLDLGLVGLRDKPTTSGDVGPSAVARGTGDYMSPEQWQDFEEVDIRADLYSVGCTLFKLLSGYAPYQRDSSDGLSKKEQHLHSPIPDIRQVRSDVPAGLQKVLQSLLAKSRDDRYSTPNEALDALLPFCRGADMFALAERLFGADVRPKQRRLETQPASTAPSSRRLRYLLATAGCLAMVAIAWSIWPEGQQPRVRTDRWRELSLIQSDAVVSLDDLEEPRWEDAKVEWPGLRVESRGQSFFHLGQPVSDSFTIRTGLRRTPWVGRSGVFFRHRTQNSEKATVQSFDAIELSIREDSSGDWRSRIEWCEYQLIEDGAEKNVLQTLHGHLQVSVEMKQPVHELKVKLVPGQPPLVSWNGQSMPTENWVGDSERFRRQFWRESYTKMAYFCRLGLLNTGVTGDPPIGFGVLRSLGKQKTANLP